jgi:hypothetical protein
MVAYSGTGINDLGYYTGCKKTDKARYVLFKPLNFAVISFCGPKVCEKDDYQVLIDKFTAVPNFTDPDIPN